MLDSEIVTLFWNRDENAIMQTQKKYERYLIKIALNILSDIGDAQESVNDTYLAAWNSIPPHKPDVLSTYLGKLARRISIDIFRKRNREKRRESQYELSLSELGECLAGGDSPEQQVDAKLLSEAINRFLQELPEEARNLFVGRYYFLDPLKEVARYCDMSESKAKSILFRTRNSLKIFLEKEGFYL